MMKPVIKFTWRLRLLTAVMAVLSFSSCMDDDEWLKRHEISLGDSGVFVVNEGNFMYGNATLSFINDETNEVQDKVFYFANGLPLGDVGQSMTISGDRGFIMVNNSGKIYVMNIHSGEYVGKITGLVSPRNIHMVSSTKAYVTDLYAGAIQIVNPNTYEITGSIPTPGHASTEHMAALGKYIYVTCWSHDNTILVIDSETDSIVDEIKVGTQPNSLVFDRDDMLWTICDGGYERDGKSRENPVLQKIDPGSRQVIASYEMEGSNSPSKLAINGTLDTLYFINKDIWSMPVDAQELPLIPFLPHRGTIFYGLGVNPETSEVYVSDAIDYLQPGIVFRLSPQGEKVDSFRVGIIPGAFCFK